MSFLKFCNLVLFTFLEPSAAQLAVKAVGVASAVPNKADWAESGLSPHLESSVKISTLRLRGHKDQENLI